MRKIFFLSLLLILIFSCKKVKFSPEGPTDVRVRNLSDLTFNEVIVNTMGGIDTLGNINPGDISDYYRFEKAYPKAEISAKLNGILFSTGPVNVTYLQYLGQDRITYEVYISSMNKKELKINNVIHEEPLIIK